MRGGEVVLNWFSKKRPINHLDTSRVKDRATFLLFMAALRQDLQDKPEGWENTELPRFLEAMSAWTKAAQIERSPNPWRLAADLLMAASIYE